MIIKGISEFLEGYRISKKMTIKEFQGYLNVKKGTYYNIMNLEKVSDAETIVHMIKLFGHDFELLLGLKENTLQENKNEKDVFLKLLDEQKLTNQLLRESLKQG